MSEQVKTDALRSRRGQLVAIAVTLAALLLITLLIAQLVPTKRSVTAYCQTYKLEQARLAKLPGDTYSSAVFDESISDASQFAKSLANLEKVAPYDIRSDVATLQSIYQKIHSDPSQAVSASVSGLSTENSVKEWTRTHCSN